MGIQGLCEEQYFGSLTIWYPKKLTGCPRLLIYFWSPIVWLEKKHCLHGFLQQISPNMSRLYPKNASIACHKGAAQASQHGSSWGFLPRWPHSGSSLYLAEHPTIYLISVQEPLLHLIPISPHPVHVFNWYDDVSNIRILRGQGLHRVLCTLNQSMLNDLKSKLHTLLWCSIPALFSDLI